MAKVMNNFVAFLMIFCVTEIYSQSIPPFIRQCRSDIPDLTKCFIQSMHHIRPFLAKGISEINMPSTEPFKIDELSLSLTTGPNGYKVTLKDIDVFGASNFSVTSLKLASGKKPYEARIVIPKLRIASKYTSSGVLIILPASGNGTFHGTLNEVSTICRGYVSTNQRNGAQYLHIDTMDLDMNVKSVRMMVKKVFNNNKILTEATNLFLKENGLEVLKAMIPQLRKKLASVFMQIGNHVFDNVPLNTLYQTI